MREHGAATSDARTVAIRAEQMMRDDDSRALEIARSRAREAEGRRDGRALAIWRGVVAAVQSATPQHR